MEDFIDILASEDLGYALWVWLKGKANCFIWVMSNNQKPMFPLRGAVKKTHSIFKDIIQIEVDPPPSHPIFDKFIFDTVLIVLTSLPALEFLTKIMKC